MRGHSDAKAERECPYCGPSAKTSVNPLVGAAPVLPKHSAKASIHRAANEDFDPQDYEFLGAFDSKTGVSMTRFNEVTKDAQWAEDVPHGDQCSHCGARIRYMAVLKHSSGEHITVGETCLGNRFSQSKEEFRAAREIGKAETARMEREVMEADAAKRRELFKQERYAAMQERFEEMARQRDEMFAAHPSQLAMVTYPEMFDEDSYARELSMSMSRHLDDNPTLTDRQIAFFLSTVEKDTGMIRKKEQDERRKAQAIAAGMTAPRGKRVEIEGVVSSIKAQEHQYGVTMKMRVALPGGAGVYVTIPSSISEVEKGERVRLTADFTAPNDGDPMFAFGSRPKNAQIIRD